MKGVGIFVLLLFVHCKSTYTMSSSCLNPANFEKAAIYVQDRVLSSGTGIFFSLEYPEDKSQVYDGIKRPSNHPENMYRVHYEKKDACIILKGEAVLLSIKEDGYIFVENTAEKSQAWAEEVFCYLYRKTMR